MATGSSSTDTTLPLDTIFRMLTIKLSSTNYFLWKDQILPLLADHNLLGYVDGTIAAPPLTITIDGKISFNPDFTIWKEANQKAILIIHSSLTEEAMNKVLGLSTAQKVWCALKSAYMDYCIELAVYLRDSLRQLQKGTSTVLEYGREFKGLCDQLADIGLPIADTEKTDWFLCGLGPSFEIFSTAQRGVIPQPTFHDLFSQAQGHELLLKSPPTAFTAQPSWLSSGFCFKNSGTPTFFGSPLSFSHSNPSDLISKLQSLQLQPPDQPSASPFMNPSDLISKPQSLQLQPESRPEQPSASPFMNQWPEARPKVKTYPDQLQTSYNQSHGANLTSPQTQANHSHTTDNVTSLNGVQNPPKKCSLDLLRGPGGELPQKLKSLETRIIDQISNEIMDADPNCRLDDIGGLHHAKKCVTEMAIWPLLRPDIFKGCRSPGRGLLLFGPPGTGKTMIGKAIAGECNATFFYISASSIISKWFGDGEKLVRALFGVAGCRQPAVIFVDEIDSLLSRRKDGEHEATRRIKTQLLIEMDGFNTDSQQILLIGATNRPQELDEAARRRLSTRLYIPLPSAEARAWIVRNLLSKDGLFKLSTEDVDTICKLTEGYSGSDMKNLVKDASMGPLREALRQGAEITKLKLEDMRSVILQDFEDALRKVRPSVSLNELGKYEDWNKQFGSKIDI